MPKKQDDRPGHDDNHQAGADWMTGELHVCEYAPVVYLSGERVAEATACFCASVVGLRLARKALVASEAASVSATVRIFGSTSPPPQKAS